MDQAIVQLGLALTPALAAGFIIKRVTLPWEKQKRVSERAELLSLMAQDIIRVKEAMAVSLNSARVSSAPKINLANWNKVKKNPALQKYTDEKIFKMMISQFREWEGMAN